MVTLIQAAREVNLSRERLRQLIRDGELPEAELVGRGFRLPRTAVDRLKREPRPKPGPKGPRRPAPPPGDPGP
jgi:excisionase family DNA binding protein